MKTVATPFGIVAHRGLTSGQVANSAAAFRRARALGIEAVELDVRLARDGKPFVHHDYQVVAGDVTRPIFALDSLELEALSTSRSEPIPALEAVLDEFAGTIGLEIELKGPEPEAADVVAELLSAHRGSWDSIEVTSFDGTLLRRIAERCPGLATALLFPATEPWMTDEIVAYAALHRARAAGAATVHLGPAQLAAAVLTVIRSGGVDVHAHSVNDERALAAMTEYAIPWVCSDVPEAALAFRETRRAST